MSEETTTDLDKEYTVEQAAQMLAILQITDHVPNPETVRRWLRAGRLRGFKDKSERGQGGQWKITLAQLLAFHPKNRGKHGRPLKPIHE